MLGGRSAPALSRGGSTGVRQVYGILGAANADRYAPPLLSGRALAQLHALGETQVSNYQRKGTAFFRA